MGIFSVFLEFLRGVFNRGGPDAAKRAELKKTYAFLAQIRPPYYKPKENMVLPGFAQGVYNFRSILRPLVDMARKTISHSDIRIYQRFFDYLVDARLPESSREKKASFSYEGMKARIENSVRSDEEFEAIGREFQEFLRLVDSLSIGDLDRELAEVEQFSDICRYDWDRIVGLFDPGANMDNPSYRPDFQAADGEKVLPELIDLYYILADFTFSETLARSVLVILERQAPQSAGPAQKQKVEKIFAALNKGLTLRLHRDVLLALIRALKLDPLYDPPIVRETTDYVERYRRRMVTQFEKDRERLQREQHENAISTDIEALFGSVEVAPVEGYDEEMDTYLRKESPNGFTHIKPLRILKTFVHNNFERDIKEPVKRVLVEGYFDNKGFQNNLANLIYQCERSAGRIDEFEASLHSNARISLIAMKRYVEEMRRGKDVSQFLNRLVDAINQRAREICEDETRLYQMLGESMGDLLTDYRRPSPDLVTNIRTLGGGRNKEILNQIAEGKRQMDTLMRIMRNFTYIKGVPTAAEASALEVGTTPAGPFPETNSEDPSDVELIP
jgi:hypothetical protein